MKLPISSFSSSSSPSSSSSWSFSSSSLSILKRSLIHFAFQVLITIMPSSSQFNFQAPLDNFFSSIPPTRNLSSGNPAASIPSSSNTNPASLQARLDQLAIEKAELENAKLRQEIKESEARTAAVTIPSHSITATVDRPEEITSEIPSEVSIVAAKFRGLPQEEIAKIYTGKFNPINLYKLRYVKKVGEVQRGDRTTSDADLLSIKKAEGTMKNYRGTSTIWSESFLNYSQIMVSFFGTTHPDIFFALGKYHHEILDLAKAYEWQQGYKLFFRWPLSSIQTVRS